MATKLGKLKDNSGNVLYMQTSANKVVNTPYGDVTATDVQTAINQINDFLANKVNINGDNAAFLDHNFINGFIPKSNATTPDEDIDITSGKALCKDLTTFVELSADATGLSMPTLLGSALANSTSYHLFRYKKKDDTDQWHLSTSLTPTIADIKSANAYRRVFSFKTNSTGDIIKFYSIDLGRDLEIKYLENNGIKDLDTTTLPTASRSALTLSCPNNTEASLNVKFLDDDSTSDHVLLTEEVQTDSPASVNVHTISAEDESINNIYIKMKTNNSSQIYYRGDGANVGFLKIYTLGYITRRMVNV